MALLPGQMEASSGRRGNNSHVPLSRSPLSGVGSTHLQTMESPLTSTKIHQPFIASSLLTPASEASASVKGSTSPRLQGLASPAFPSLWIFDFEFSPFNFCLRLNDVDSGISTIIRALCEPPRPVTQEVTFRKNMACPFQCPL